MITINQSEKLEAMKPYENTHKQSVLPAHANRRPAHTPHTTNRLGANHNLRVHWN